MNYSQKRNSHPKSPTLSVLSLRCMYNRYCRHTGLLPAFPLGIRVSVSRPKNCCVPAFQSCSKSPAAESWPGLASSYLKYLMRP